MKDDDPAKRFRDVEKGHCSHVLLYFGWERACVRIGRAETPNIQALLESPFRCWVEEATSCQSPPAIRSLQRVQHSVQSNRTPVLL